MTLRLSRSTRFLWHLLAAMQLMLPGAAAWADAIAERDSERGYVHVESQSNAGCARVHDADCALCQLLGSALDSPAPASCVAPAVARVLAPTAAHVAVVAVARHAPQLPRAPPGQASAA